PPPPSRLTRPSDTSPAPPPAAFPFCYDFDNDGAFEITNSTSASATVPASFLDDGPGTQTVRGQIQDKDGGFTNYTASITIVNVAPTTTLTWPPSANEGSTATASFSSH